jgi:uncharacterized membrane protein (DUF485 family)
MRAFLTDLAVTFAILLAVGLVLAGFVGHNMYTRFKGPK